MPQTLAAILPHSPLLIPEIGKDNQKILNNTLTAYNEVADKLQQLNTEVIIIISSHGSSLPDSFSLGLAPQFNISFKDFGCFLTRPSIKPALKLADAFKESLDREIPCQFVSQINLDYGSAIPLTLLKAQENQQTVLPIFPANNLNWLEHYNFGEKLGEFIASRPEKIALIASGDMSHRLTVNSPGGYSIHGNRFDNKIKEYLNYPTKVKEKLLNLDPQKVAEAQECLLKPLLITLGAIGQKYQPELLAYQKDFGVGYLSFLFDSKPINY